MKQLHQEVVWRELHKRSTSRMTKARIGPLDTSTKFVICERVANERSHHFERNLFVAGTTHRGNVVSTELWDGLWDIQATVTRKTGQHRFFKCENRSSAAR